MGPGSLLLCGTIILPDRLLVRGAVWVRGGRIVAVDHESTLLSSADPATTTILDAGDGYIAPGFVDLHVHGGLGADFMDGTADSYRTALLAHARHGTTSLTPTTTVARHEQIISVLKLTREFMRPKVPGAAVLPRVLGAHFYGPYFRYEARGAHPGAAIRPPVEREFAEYLEFADALATATVAPELPGAEEFARACTAKGVRLNAGHSWATFEQMRAAVRWGVRHIDHLYCAMSDKTRLRQFQTYPMQGGVLEATLFFDELTTEVIADGKHLSPDLLELALKIKGPDRLALVTDCNRALDMPEGEYMIGPLDGGEPLLHRDGVGLMPDGKGLASSVRGMDHMLRTFLEQTGRPLWEVVRMASLTPAQILGREHEIGSLTVGKYGDAVVLDRELGVRRVFVAGAEIE
ncbi:MAG: amidohydrolase family protein [Planctomycetia bacterium]|nr:amidohydrolase family protein [Planctomycetia bacterium]